MIRGVKPFQYFVATLLGLACVGLSVSLILMASINQKAQGFLQERQQALNNGVLGPQGQQLSNKVLQDMARLAVYDPDMRKLLVRHGFQVPAPENAKDAATNAMPRVPAREAVTP